MANSPAFALNDLRLPFALYVYVTKGMANARRTHGTVLGSVPSLSLLPVIAARTAKRTRYSERMAKVWHDPHLSMAHSRRTLSECSRCVRQDTANEQRRPRESYGETNLGVYA